MPVYYTGEQESEQLMNETQAISLCLGKRDPEGFMYLYKKYRREAHFHAMGFLGNRDDSRDMCQEAFSRAFASMLRLRSLDSFYPWFYRILRNCCLNFLDRKETVVRYEPELTFTANECRRSETPDRARHVGHDIMAVLKNLVGGEIEEYTKLMAESREQALDRLAEHAKRLGANAVVGIRFSTSEIMSGAAELFAFGTAVVCEDMENK
jgi:RNA polymerase sigma factor (sigma-70 family)